MRQVSALLGWLLLAACAKAPAPPDALSFVAPDAAVVGEADVRRLAGSGLVQRFLLDGAGRRSIDILGGDCGQDPLPHIERVTFTMSPAGMSRGEFALVIEGALDPEEILACARRRAPGELEVAGWSGARVILAGSLGSGVVALVPDGPILVGEGRLVRQMLARAVRRGPSIRDDRTLMEVFASLGRTRAARLVLRPSSSLREQARARLVPGLAALAELELLAIGLSAGSDLELTMMARLSDPTAARALVGGARETLRQTAADPTVAASPFAGPLEALSVVDRDRDVIARFALTAGQIEAIGELLPR